MTFSRFCLLGFLTSLAFIQPVRAELRGVWGLTGKFQATAAVKGKTQTLKQKALDQMTLSFNQDGRCEISANVLAIEGRYSTVKRKFKTEMSFASANAVLRSIEKDLAAKSGLQLVLEAEKLSLNGSEQKNGTIKGRFTLIARSLFLDYANKAGRLTLTYDFVGSRFDTMKSGPKIQPD
jgi:hypothetical protein